MWWLLFLGHWQAGAAEDRREGRGIINQEKGEYIEKKHASVQKPPFNLRPVLSAITVNY